MLSSKPATKMALTAIRSLSTKCIKPSVIMGFGTADKPLAYGSIMDHADVTFIKEHLSSYLGEEGIQALKKMSPRELSQLADTTVDNLSANGYILPGSTNTIPDFFCKKDAPMPSKLDVGSARSIFKMALSRKLSSEKTPTLYSCDGINYLILVLGGELSPSSNYHTGGSHPTFLTKQPNYLTHKIRETNPYKITNDIMIPSTMSTHPLTPTKLPQSAKVLAEADDESPSIILLKNINAIGLVDHFEERNNGFMFFKENDLDILYKDYKALKGEDVQEVSLDNVTILNSTQVFDILLKNFL